ncbi:MAG: hypothetical protein AAGC88_01120, partial [Bacteroidota bacterium]
MNQSTNSLEDKLKGRLQDFEAPPPPGMGGAILDQVNGGSDNSPWLISLVLLLGVLLLGTGYYMITDQDGITDSSAIVNEIPKTSLDSEVAGEQASLVGLLENNTKVQATTNNSGLVVADNAADYLTNETTKSNANTVLDAEESAQDESSNQESAAIVRAAVLDEVGAANNQIVAAPLSDQVGTVISGEVSFDQLLIKELDSDGSLLSASTASEIAIHEPKTVRPPKKQRHYHWYGDLGVFFLYNHLQPNPYDNLIMENFETAGSFSLDRLSYYAEVGLKRELSRRVTLRAAAVTNLFAQKYSFDIRGEASSAVTTDGSEGELLTPVFERQMISMDHMLVSAGVRLSSDNKAINNDHKRFMIGLGYHRNLNT